MRGSKSKVRQRRRRLPSRAQWPVEPPFVLADRQVVDARDAKAHQAVGVEFPVLVAVAARPCTLGILRLVGETHGDAVALESPKLLGEAVFALALPLALQEGRDGIAALQELAAIAPAAVHRVRLRDPGRVARVPG